MNLKQGHRLMRVPAPAGRKQEGTAILDADNKIVAYSKRIVGVNEKNPQWDFVRRDNKV